MINFLKTNKTAASLIVVAVIAVAGMFAVQGCSIGDLIKHDVPASMQKFNQDEAKVSLNDSPYVREAYVADTERNIRAYDEDYEGALLIFDAINSAVTLGIDQIGTSAFPGGMAIVSLLLGGIGLTIPKPGTAKKLASEKEDSFNEGLKQGKELVSG